MSARMPEEKQEPENKAAGKGGPVREQEGAYQIAAVAGIPIRLHWTFIMLLAVAFVVSVTGGRGDAPGAPPRFGVLVILALFICVVLHELGHALVARRYGIGTKEILLLPLGGIARLETVPRARQELWIALAGPAVNFVLAGLFALLLKLPLPEASAGPVQSLLGINLVLGIFNMIPAFPMDGGRVLRALLARVMDELTATIIAVRVGQIVAILMGVVGVLLGQWMLALIAVMVYFGAGQELSAYRTKQLADGHRVREAMVRQFVTLPVGSTLREAADALLAGNQQDFPIVHGGEVVGVLSRNALLKAMAKEGPDGYVAGAMEREFATVGPEEELEPVLARLPEVGVVLIITDGSYHTESLVGMLTQENALEFLTLTQIQRLHSRPA